MVHSASGIPAAQNDMSAPHAFPTYRHRPHPVDAYRYDQKPENYRPDWFQDLVSDNKIITFANGCTVLGEDAPYFLPLGNWLIRHEGGGLMPVTASFFEQNYEIDPGPDQNGLLRACNELLNLLSARKNYPVGSWGYDAVHAAEIAVREASKGVG